MAALVWLTVAGARAKEAGEMRRFFFLNLTPACLALLLAVVIPFFTYARIFNGPYEAEWQAWAWDAFALSLRMTVPLGLVLLLITGAGVLLTVPFDRRGPTYGAVIRRAATVASSGAILAVTPFYAAMAETPVLPLDVYFLVFGVCEALVFRLVFAAEFALRLKKRKDGQQTEKKKGKFSPPS